MLGCGNRETGNADPSKKESLTEQALTAGNSNELTGTWLSPCVQFINNQFARVTYIFSSEGALEVLNQIYFDDDCRTLDETEHLKGSAAYGNAIAKPAGAKAIDLKVRGKIHRSSYIRNGEELCFGSQSSPLIDGRPSEINCKRPFKRL